MNVLWLVWAALAAVVECGGAEPAHSLLFRSRSTFDVESTVLMNELGGKRRDVGYRLQGELIVEPLAYHDDQLLLRFQLQKVLVLSRGAHALAEWERRGAAWHAPGAEGEFYGEWSGTGGTGGTGGLLAYLSAGDPPDVRNYKRAILSLFQFQLVDGEYKETDVSGECDVTYETISSTVFRKIKRRCAYEREGVGARRVSRYTLSAGRGALAALHAEEVVWLSHGADSEDALGVKARSWHALTLRSDLQAHPLSGPHALQAARAAISAPLQRTPLPMSTDESASALDDEPAESLEGAVESFGAALAGSEPGAGGTLDQLAALQPMLRALRVASTDALANLLRAPRMHDLLPGLCRALGLAGTRPAWHAARAFLAPHAADALEPLALQYLAGLATALAPHDEVTLEVLALGEEAARPRVAEAALLAAAAASGRASPGAARAVRDRLTGALARARSPAGRAVLLLALGNTLEPEAAGALLAAAERGAAQEAEAALGALRGCGAGLGLALLERAALLAGNASRPLAVRALALEAAVEGLCARGRATVPMPLVVLARALLAERGEPAHELRRALWQRLETLEAREAVRALRRLMPRDLRTWNARAPAGTSGVLVRELGWTAAGWRGALSSVQLASRALLLRGRVALHALHDRGPEAAELLAVEVWTRGLETIAGGEAAGEAAGGEAGGEGGPAAGLRVSVRGAALPPVTLFDGQADLLGHIWSGAGSTPQSAVRALLPLAEWKAAVPLQAGAVLAGSATADAALALDAHAVASLWHRTARARLALRGAARAAVRAQVHTGWARLAAAAEDAGEARLHIAPDLDFYDGVALCVRVAVDPHAALRTVRLQSECGSGAWRVLRNSTRRVQHAGRTLALGRDNDAACRAHAPLDPDSADY